MYLLILWFSRKSVKVSFVSHPGSYKSLSNKVVPNKDLLTLILELNTTVKSFSVRKISAASIGNQNYSQIDSGSNHYSGW